MSARDVLVCVSVHPARRPWLAQVTAGLGSFDLSIVAAAPGDDAGPLTKWIWDHKLKPRHRAVVIIDDDHVYQPKALRHAAMLACSRAPALVQACARQNLVVDNPASHGGAYMLHRYVWTVQRTDIVEAFAGVACESAAFVRLRDRLRAVEPDLGTAERLSDDLIVSREAAHMGFALLVAPVEPPVRLPCADIEAVSQKGDGIYPRYKRLLVAETRPWWKGTRP